MTHDPASLPAVTEQRKARPRVCLLGSTSFLGWDQYGADATPGRISALFLSTDPTLITGFPVDPPVPHSALWVQVTFTVPGAMFCYLLKPIGSLRKGTLLHAWR